jgi:hypothetical protein
MRVRSYVHLDQPSDMEGPWCRFRRDARARERGRHRPVDSLKALDPNGPIREVDIATTPTHVRFKAVTGGFAISAKGQKRTLATRVAIESGADPSAMFGASDRMMAQAKGSTS